MKPTQRDTKKKTRKPKRTSCPIWIYEHRFDVERVPGGMPRPRITTKRLRVTKCGPKDKVQYVKYQVEPDVEGGYARGLSRVSLKQLEDGEVIVSFSPDLYDGLFLSLSPEPVLAKQFFENWNKVRAREKRERERERQKYEELGDSIRKIRGHMTSQEARLILGLPKGVSPGEIKRRFRDLSFSCHPDKGGDLKRFQEITVAYKTLRPKG